LTFDILLDQRHCRWCLPKPVGPSSESIFGYCTEGQKNETYVFDSDFCQTKFTILPIIFMILYLVFFAIGYAPLCWVLNGEFYPLWARSTGCALSTFSNWIFNLLVSLTYLTLSQAVTRYGNFAEYCFA
uniref:G_PROTEIN_RECEP_F1_2 domain-containing protein n=1 Tax=Gongylonema pulchrum TaxID=637853 RepID=A0A183D7F2_9BILA